MTGKRYGCSWLHLVAVLLLAACDSSEPGPPGMPDREVLTVLYESTGGSGWWRDRGWLTDDELSTWDGVQTDEAGRVVGIALGRNNLVGPIPHELGGLSNLEHLNLGANSLTGPIPAELGNLSSLEVLMLCDNPLTGQIPPELGSLSNLAFLNLSNNSLQGPIPPELGSLSSAWILWLSNNSLTGPIPPELGNLSSLEVLMLHDNPLTGQIPPELRSLSSLRSLLLSETSLAGPLPHELVGLDLTSFFWDDTNLCAPDDPAFLSWLGSIKYYRGGEICAMGG